MDNSIMIENKENDLTFELNNLVISGTIPLDDYYTKEQTDSMFDNYYDKQEVDDIISQIEITAGNYTSGSGINISDDNVISVDETVAFKTDIPDTSNFVDTETNQTIGGNKTFMNLTARTPFYINGGANYGGYISHVTKSKGLRYYPGSYPIGKTNYGAFWFNDIPIKLSGDDLVEALNQSSVTDRLYAEQIVICTQNDTNNTYLAGHIYLIGGTSNAYTATDITPTVDTSSFVTEESLSGRVIPEGSNSSFDVSGRFLILSRQQNSTYEDTGIKFNNTATTNLATIYASEDTSFSIAYKNYYYDATGFDSLKVGWNFDDVQIQISGNSLETNLTVAKALNIGKVYLCTETSTSGAYVQGHIYKIGGTSGAYTATDITPTSDTSALETEIDNIVNNITKIANTNGGGFAAGTNSSATLGGAVGQGATTYQGGAVGFQSTTRSGAGGAIGYQASASGGGAAGYQADTNEGGAVGNGAVSGNGFSGGYNAKTGTSYSNAVDTIQLGTGTNSTVHSLQIYDDNIYNADTHTLTVDNIELNGTELTTLDDLSGVAVLSSTQQVGVQAGEYIGIMGNSVVSYPNGSKQLPTTMLIPIAAGENITFTPNSTNTSIEISATGVIKFQTTTFGDLFNTLSSLYNSGNHIQSISFNCQYSLNNNRRDITINTDGTISASTGYDYILQSGDYYNFTFNRVDYQNNEIYAYLFLSRDESSDILTLTLTDSTASFSMSRMNVNETNVVLRGNSGKFNQNAQNVTIYYI